MINSSSRSFVLLTFFRTCWSLPASASQRPYLVSHVRTMLLIFHDCKKLLVRSWLIPPAACRHTLRAPKMWIKLDGHHERLSLSINYVHTFWSGSFSTTIWNVCNSKVDNYPTVVKHNISTACVIKRFSRNQPNDTAANILPIGIPVITV